MNTRRSCGECCTRLVEFGVAIRGQPILEHVNLHMHCGELTAVIGPNGAGKTTLLRAMIGELPHTGALRFIHQGNVEDSKPLRIGYVPQKLELDATAPTTVLDLFAGALSRRPLWFGTGKALRETTRSKLAETGAEHLMACRLAEISVGQLQRVLLALALTPVPELLLLDEPVTGLDQAGIELFYQTVSRLRADYDLSILLVSHDLLAAGRVADRMILVNRTVLCDDTPKKVLGDPLVARTVGFAPRVEELAADGTPDQSLPREQCEFPLEGEL